MSSDGWSTARLGDFIEVQHGFAFKTKYANGEQSPYALFTRKNFALGGGFREDEPRYYAGPFEARFVLEPGDLMVVLTDLSKNGDLLGLPAIVPSRGEVRYLHNQRVGKVLVKNPGIDHRFLYSLLRSPGYRRHVLITASQTTVRDTAPSRLHDYTFRLPPLDEQRRIGEVLGALDDKIDSNRRLAALLEDTAATLFRALFVDFVGVEEFEESEIGPIPTGWRAGALTDLARFVNGKAFTKHANGVGRPILRIRELNSGVDDGTPRSDIDVADDYVACADDILFAWSGSLGVYRWPGDESLINQHIFKVVPDSWPAWFVYAWIREHMNTFRAIAADKATTMGHIQRRHLSDAKLPLPPTEAVARAHAVVGPIDRHRAALVQETTTLGQLRDALLPKLISDQIQVSDTADPDAVIEPVATTLATAAS